jgi:hypothetical protein
MNNAVYPSFKIHANFSTITITYHPGLVQQASSGRSTQSPTAQIKNNVGYINYWNGQNMQTAHEKWTQNFRSNNKTEDFIFIILVCEAIGTAATPGLLCQPRVIVKMIVVRQMECGLAGET